MPNLRMIDLFAYLVLHKSLLGYKNWSETMGIWIWSLKSRINPSNFLRNVGYDLKGGVGWERDGVGFVQEHQTYHVMIVRRLERIKVVSHCQI